MNLHAELLNFDYREMEVPFSILFPRVDMAKVNSSFAHLKSDNPHQTILNVARELWDGHYEKLMDDFGFWDKAYEKFSGHCHQCTPVLGLVLKSLGFEVSFLECFRIRDSYLKDKKLVQVPPEEEPNPDMKEEFCNIKRIPYCCLEVLIDNKPFYLTGKHLKPKDGDAVALLSPSCYRYFIGVFKHQDDSAKSGIYLKPVSTGRRVVWLKQTSRDPLPEVFATFLRMRLV